jgi:integrase/recombinase XerD
MPYKRGKIWYACVYDEEKGVHVRESSKSTKKADADLLEEKIRQRIEEERKRCGQVSFVDAALLFTEKHFPKIRIPTQKIYKLCLRTISDFFEESYVNDITAKKAKQFRNWLQIDKEMSEPMITAHMRCLSSFLSFCAEFDLIEFNPIIAARIKLTATAVRQRIFTKQEQEIILRKAKRDMIPFVLLCLECGLRHTEALSVKLEHIDFEKNELKIPDGKGGKARVIPMTDAVRAQFLTHNFSDSDGLFFASPTGGRQITKWRAWQTLIKRCGIEDARIHDLRRTYGSNLREKGVAMHTISSLMGHSTSNVTERVYAKPRMPELHQAVKQMQAPDAQIMHIDELIEKRRKKNNHQNP